MSTPNVQLPPEAVESGLGGTVRVSVTVDAQGNVVDVGKALGPGAVCSQISRPDVVAMRNIATKTARNVKLAPVQAGEPALARSWVNIEFRGTEVKDEFVEPVSSEPAVAESGDAKKPRDPNKFTVKGDVNLSATSAPPPDYQGPVAVSKDQASSDKNEKYTIVGDGNYSAAAGSAIPGSATGVKTLSGGVVNGKAESLPKPPYPPAARALRASGAVSVQVLIDTDGKVFETHAVSGHPLLRPASVTAACSAEFSPTLLMGTPVKVSGVIVYNFVP